MLCEIRKLNFNIIVKYCMAIVFIEMKTKLCSVFFNLHKPLERHCRSPGHGSSHAGAQQLKQTRPLGFTSVRWELQHLWSH
jgi:hypothetical protein